MSDTQWKLSGAVGNVELPENLDPQHMTQGVGFPLRTVAGVPPVDTGDTINPDTVDSDSDFMTFYKEGWQQGKAYTAGSVVTNGLFTMVANKLTFDNPYPTPDGNPTFTIPAFAPTTQSNTSVVTSGHQWTLTEDTLIDEVRVWVPSISATTFYKVTLLIQVPGQVDPSGVTFDNPLLVPGEFTIVSKTLYLLPVGTVLTAVLEAIETAGGNTVQGQWQRVLEGIGVPGAGQWRTDASRIEIRVSKIDENANDRSTDLGTVGIDTTVLIVETADATRNLSLTVTGPAIDQGTAFLYPCVKTGQGLNGEPRNNQSTSMTFEVPTVLVTEYSEELLGLADTSWATVVPFLEFNGVDQSPVADTAFGVDVEGEITVFSNDWDVFSGP